MLKCYTIKLDTRVGQVIIESVIEFVAAKRYFYYSTLDDKVGRVKRSSIKRAFRLISDSSKWVEIHMKNFIESGKEEDKTE